MLSARSHFKYKDISREIYYADHNQKKAKIDTILDNVDLQKYILSGKEGYYLAHFP